MLISIRCGISNTCYENDERWRWADVYLIGVRWEMSMRASDEASHGVWGHGKARQGKLRSGGEEWNRRRWFIRNGRLRVKHQGRGWRCRRVYQTLSWRVVSLSLRDVMEGAIGVKGFSYIHCLLRLQGEPSFVVLNTWHHQVRCMFGFSHQMVIMSRPTSY